MAEIEFDFCIAGQAEQKIKDVKEQMKGAVLPEFEETLCELAKAWSGENGSLFQTIAERELEYLKHTAKLVESAGRSMKNAIIYAKSIEEKTKEIAETRTY